MKHWAGDKVETRRLKEAAALTYKQHFVFGVSGERRENVRLSCPGVVSLELGGDVIRPRKWNR